METTKKKKARIWTYSPFHSFKCNGIEQSLTTQLYQIGIYGIYNNDSNMQTSFSNPQPIIELQRRLRKAEEKKEITDLYFSPTIRVIIDEDEFLIQLKDETL